MNLHPILYPSGSYTVYLFGIFYMFTVTYIPSSYFPFEQNFCLKMIASCITKINFFIHSFSSILKQLPCISNCCLTAELASFKCKFYLARSPISWIFSMFHGIIIVTSRHTIVGNCCKYMTTLVLCWQLVCPFYDFLK